MREPGVLVGRRDRPVRPRRRGHRVGRPLRPPRAARALRVRPERQVRPEAAEVAAPALGATRRRHRRPGGRHAGRRTSSGTSVTGRPCPTESDRWPRPPSMRPSSSELQVARHRRHLDPDVAGGCQEPVAADGLDGERARAGQAAGDSLTSPLVVVDGQRAHRRGPELDVARHRPDDEVRVAVATMSRSPETASMAIRPADGAQGRPRPTSSGSAGRRGGRPPRSRRSSVSTTTVARWRQLDLEVRVRDRPAVARSSPDERWRCRRRGRSRRARRGPVRPARGRARSRRRRHAGGRRRRGAAAGHDARRRRWGARGSSRSVAVVIARSSRAPGWRSAASSALISWRATASRISSRVRPVTGASGGRLVGVVGIGPRPEAQGADERLDARADRRVADAELALHLAQVAARAEEALEQGQLVAVQPAEPADAEVALEGRPAAPAMEPGDGQLVEQTGQVEMTSCGIAVDLAPGGTARVGTVAARRSGP